MNIIKTVGQWLGETTQEDVIQMTDNSVMSQLGKLDESNTGIGFVFVLVPIAENSTPESVVLDVTSYSVFKIKNIWYVIVDENVSDIACALVRMITSNIDK